MDDESEFKDQVKELHDNSNFLHASLLDSSQIRSTFGRQNSTMKSFTTIMKSDTNISHNTTLD